MSEELKEWYNAVPYAEIKNIIRDRMSVMAREYVGIGFYLRRVRDNEMYLEDGYKDVHEFAMAEFGMSRSTVNHCIRINEQFSVDGNSPTIDNRYKDFSKSQLQEMLYLPDDKLDEITPDMTVKEIRGLKTDQLDVEPENDQIPGQMTVEDYPECLPDESSVQEAGTDDIDQGVEVRKPTQEEKVILAAFARKLIRDKRDYFIRDYRARVLDTSTSGKLLYEHIFPRNTGWYFKDSEGLLYSIDLFEDYIQLWSGSEFIGNFEWFYLMAQVQAQWNIVAMEDAEKQRDGQAANEEQLETSESEAESGNDVDIDIDNVVDAEVQQDPEEDECAAESEKLDEVTYSEIFIRDYLEEEERTLAEYEAADSEEGGMPINLMMRQRMLVKALRLLMEHESDQDDEEQDGLEESETVQPELPVLRNNDQRKEFLDSFHDWPIWFEVPEASEVYYRFDLPDGSSIVICEYRWYADCKWMANDNPDMVGTREYLLKPGYHYLHDCSSSRTSLIEHLKEVQKK